MSANINPIRSQSWYVYLLLSRKLYSWYIGSTKGIKKRILSHNDEKNKSTKHGAPWKLTYCKCKKIWVDGCDDYVRTGGNDGDYKLITK